jgi:hypothetical protein
MGRRPLRRQPRQRPDPYARRRARACRRGAHGWPADAEASHRSQTGAVVHGISTDGKSRASRGAAKSRSSISGRRGALPAARKSPTWSNSRTSTAISCRSSAFLKTRRGPTSSGNSQPSTL